MGKGWYQLQRRKAQGEAFARDWNRRIDARDAMLAAARRCAMQGDQEGAEDRRHRAVLLEAELAEKFPWHFKKHGGARRIPLTPTPNFKQRRH